MYVEANKSKRAKMFNAVVLAGLIVGSLDILSAFTDYYLRTGKGPEGVLRYVASGVFGKEAFTGSISMIWLGLLFHFIIAFAFTIVFFIMYPRIRMLHYSVMLTALIIGLIVWAIMNFIIVPLSNTPKSPFDALKSIKAALILIFMIGLPLSIILKKAF